MLLGEKKKHHQRSSYFMIADHDELLYRIIFAIHFFFFNLEYSEFNNISTRLRTNSSVVFIAEFLVEVSHNN